MRIIDLETINQAMDNETQFVLRCEEVFHDKVSSAARPFCPPDGIAASWR